MSKRYLYDGNDVLQGVFENENALHRYLDKTYPNDQNIKGASGKLLVNKFVLPSVFKIERRLLHKRDNQKVRNLKACLVITPSGSRMTFSTIKDASRTLNVNYKTMHHCLDRGRIERGQLKGYTIRRLEAV